MYLGVCRLKVVVFVELEGSLGRAVVAEIIGEAAERSLTIALSALTTLSTAVLAGVSLTASVVTTTRSAPRVRSATIVASLLVRLVAVLTVAITTGVVLARTTVLVAARSSAACTTMIIIVILAAVANRRLATSSRSASDRR